MAGGALAAARRATLVQVSMVVFMLVLDTTVVTVAVPSIMGDLRTDVASMQWVFDAYTLPLASLLLGAAAFGDRFGRARLFRIGVAVFTMSSAAASAAPNALSLNLTRALQGVGGAVLFGIAVPLIADAYPPGRRRDVAVGTYAAVSGAAVAIGPVVGGILTQSLGWRAIFAVNIPIGLAVLTMSSRLIRHPPSPDQVIPVLDLALGTGAVFLLVMGCIEGPRLNWSGFAQTCLGVGVIGLGGWVVRQLRASHPLVDPSMFRHRDFTFSSATGFILQASVVAATPFLTLYAQNVLGMSPLTVGLYFLPFSCCAFLSAAVTGPLIGRFGPWLLVHSLVLAGIGLLLLSRLGHLLDLKVFIPGLILAGTALGVGATAINRFAVSEVPAAQLGMASAVSTSSRQLGVVMGVAVLGLVYLSALSGAAAAVATDSVTATAIVDAATQAWSADPIGGASSALPSVSTAIVAGMRATLVTGGCASLLAALTYAGVLRGRAARVRARRRGGPTGSATP